METATVTTQLFKFESMEDFNFPAAEKIVENECERIEQWWDADWFKYDFETIAKILGFSVEDFNYTGFYSQGDGACFTGIWSKPDKDPVEEIKDYAPKDKVLHRLAKSVKEIDECLEWVEIERESSRYHHSNTMYVKDWECNDKCGKEYDECDEEAEFVLSIAKELADWAYERLEADFKYRTSEEAVKQYIIEEGAWWDCNGNKYYDIPEEIKCTDVKKDKQ